MISVVTVTLNAEKTLEETLVSIVRQTCQDFEIVAVDGGSTDSTLDIFDRYGARIGTLISEKDSGIYNAMNKGVRAAKGDFLFFLNAQDTLYSEHVFAKATDAFNSARRPLIVFGDVFFTNRSGIPRSRLLQEPDAVRSYRNAGYNDPAICHQAIFYHRRLFEAVGGYDEKYRIYADYDFNIRAFHYARDRYVYIPEIISNFDLGGVSTIVSPKYGRIQTREHAELQLKKKRLWKKAEKRAFLLSKSFTPAGGGYYIQFCGVRLDWSAFVKHFALGKLDLPVLFNFAEELPRELHVSGFHPPENWGRWIDGRRAEIKFPLRKRNQEELVRISMRICLCLLRDVRLTLLLNRRPIGLRTFSPGTTEKTSDVDEEFLVAGGRLLSGKNTLEFLVDGCSVPKEKGVSGDGRLLGIGIRTLRIETHAVIPTERRKWYEFARPLTLPFRFSGYYTPEKWGAWLRREASMDLLPVAGGGGPLRMAVAYRAFLGGIDKLRLVVEADGVGIMDVRFPDDLPEHGILHLDPCASPGDGGRSVHLVFRTENPVDVRRLFNSDDERLLGIGFERICFLSEGDELPPPPGGTGTERQ